VLVTAMSELMAKIPMVALAGVMMIAALATVNWRSMAPAMLTRMPKSETTVMIVTVVVTVATGNLALGVAGGVLLAMMLFARRVAHVNRLERTVSEDGSSVRYSVYGPLFFGSSNDLFERFSYADDPRTVSIDLTDAQIWDASSVATLDSIEAKYRDHGATVTVTGLDRRSTAFHQRLTGRL